MTENPKQRQREAEPITQVPPRAKPLRPMKTRTSLQRRQDVERTKD